MTAFVVLFEGRTGSTHLQRLLASHPDVRMQGEILIAPQDPFDQDEVARRAFKPDGKYRAVGFKTKVRDLLDPTAFADTLYEFDVRVIHMERRNLVKLALSSINGARLNEAHGRFYQTPKDEPLEPIHVEPERLVRAIRQREGFQAAIRPYVDGLKLRKLHVDYEDLLADQGKVTDQVLGFLDLDVFPLTSAVQKTTPDNLRSAVLNYDELRAHFAGTEYEAMFD